MTFLFVRLLGINVTTFSVTKIMPQINSTVRQVAPSLVIKVSVPNIISGLLRLLQVGRVR